MAWPAAGYAVQCARSQSPYCRGLQDRVPWRKYDNPENFVAQETRGGAQWYDEYADTFSTYPFFC